MLPLAPEPSSHSPQSHGIITSLPSLHHFGTLLQTCDGSFSHSVTYVDVPYTTCTASYLCRQLLYMLSPSFGLPRSTNDSERLGDESLDDLEGSILRWIKCPLAPTLRRVLRVDDRRTLGHDLGLAKHPRPRVSLVGEIL